MQKNVCGQRFGFILFFIISSILVLDQTTKYLARVELPLHVPVSITSFFNLFLTFFSIKFDKSNIKQYFCKKHVKYPDNLFTFDKKYDILK